MDNIVLFSLTFAFLSATLRGAISVIDRYQFGIHKKHVSQINILNNALTLALVLLLVWQLALFSNFKQFIIDLRVIVFALLLQATAHAFSYAFRHMKVATVIVFSKLPDILTPICIWIFFSKWSSGDFLFSAGTFVLCLPLLLHYRGKNHIHFYSAFAVCTFLILQGSLSPWYMSDVVNNQTLWLPFTAALIAWRLLFSVVFAASLKFNWSSLRSQELSLLIARALLTLGAQGFLVLSLSYGKPVLTWPILNSTGLISIVLSSLCLRERASRSEYAVVTALISLGLAKAFW